MFCSTTKIVVGSTTLLDFGDYMESEVTKSWSQEIQTEPIIRGTWGFNEGRKNSITVINWSRYYYFDPVEPAVDNDALDAARIFQQFHLLPSSASITWPSEFMSDYGSTASPPYQYGSFDINVPDGTNQADLTFEYDYGTSFQSMRYTKAVITNADAEIREGPVRVLVRYSMTCAQGTSVTPP